MLTSSESSPLKADLRNSSLEERSDDMVLVVEGLTFDDQLKDSDKVSISTPIICLMFKPAHELSIFNYKECWGGGCGILQMLLNSKK